MKFRAEIVVEYQADLLKAYQAGELGLTEEEFGHLTVWEREELWQRKMFDWAGEKVKIVKFYVKRG